MHISTPRENKRLKQKVGKSINSVASLAFYIRRTFFLEGGEETEEKKKEKRRKVQFDASSVVDALP